MATETIKEAVCLVGKNRKDMLVYDWAPWPVDRPARRTLIWECCWWVGVAILVVGELLHEVFTLLRTSGMLGRG